MTRHIKTSTGKEQTLTGEKSELFMFQGGFPFSRGLKGYYMEDKKTMNISRTKKNSKISTVYPFSICFSLYVIQKSPCGRQQKNSNNKEQGKRPRIVV